MDYTEEPKLEAEISLSQGKRCRSGVCDTTCFPGTNYSCQAAGWEHAPLSTSTFNSAQVPPKALSHLREVLSHPDSTCVWVFQLLPQTSSAVGASTSSWSKSLLGSQIQRVSLPAAPALGSSPTNLTRPRHRVLLAPGMPWGGPSPHRPWATSTFLSMDKPLGPGDGS